jgi:hypothetical protein
MSRKTIFFENKNPMFDVARCGSGLFLFLFSWVGGFVWPVAWDVRGLRVSARYLLFSVEQGGWHAWPVQRDCTPKRAHAQIIDKVEAHKLPVNKACWPSKLTCGSMNSAKSLALMELSSRHRCSHDMQASIRTLNDAFFICCFGPLTRAGEKSI